MDATRFDCLTRLWGRRGTRRGTFGLLAGALALGTGLARHGQTRAAGVGTAQDWRDYCEIAGGIPAEGVDGSFNCVMDDGWEIHCDPSGRCQSHCWKRYGCNCRHADVCHSGPLIGGFNPAATAPSGQEMAPVADAPSGSPPPPDDPQDTDGQRRRKRQRRQRRRGQRRRGQRRRGQRRRR